MPPLAFQGGSFEYIRYVNVHFCCSESLLVKHNIQTSDFFLQSQYIAKKHEKRKLEAELISTEVYGNLYGQLVLWF